MRRDVIFIADSTIDVVEIEATLNKAGYSTLANGNRLTICRSPVEKDSISVEIESKCDDFYGYEDNELSCIRQIIPNPQMIYLHFRDQELSAEISRILLNSYDMVFDDDHGNITYKGKPLICE